MDRSPIPVHLNGAPHGSVKAALRAIGMLEPITTSQDRTALRSLLRGGQVVDLGGNLLVPSNLVVVY